jgi:hypothetical protein
MGGERKLTCAMEGHINIHSVFFYYEIKFQEKFGKYVVTKDVSENPPCKCLRTL